MADNNKVEFGLSNLYVGTYTVAAGGTVTLGTPFHQVGAVSMTLDVESEENSFFADNVKYWSGYTDNGFTGSIEVARFDTDFKTQFLGYQTLTDGGVAQIKGATKPLCYVCWQAEGDVEARRCIMYGVSLGAIAREFSTIEESKEPVTESIDITVTGDNGTGIVMTSYKPADSDYATLFTNPPVPAL